MRAHHTSNNKYRLSALALCAALATGCNYTEVVSVNGTGDLANASSFNSSIAGDGRYVAFHSAASNLVAGDSNVATDIFVRDTRAGTIVRVSVDSAGAQGNAGSTNASISADGRFVAFQSAANNLVMNDTNERTDVFLHNVQTGATTRVSVNDAGNAGEYDSTNPSISADGRYIAFQSYSPNLVATRDNLQQLISHIFVHDTWTGTTIRASQDNAGNHGSMNSREAAISADGRYVAFTSRAELVPEDYNVAEDIYVHDTHTRTIKRVSVSDTGEQARGTSGSPTISADGRYVAFSSGAFNLVADDDNQAVDVFVHDTWLGTTRRVSLNDAGEEVSDPMSSEYFSFAASYDPSISADGRYVTFWSFSPDFIDAGNDREINAYVYIRDTHQNTTRQLSRDAAGAPGNGGSSWPQISADGRYVAFVTLAHNLLGEPPVNGTYHGVVIRSVPQPTVISVVPDLLPIGVTTAVTITGTDFLTGATPSIAGGVVSNVVVVDENTITLQVAVPADRAPGARNLVVNLYGTGPGLIKGSSAICGGCLSFE